MALPFSPISDLYLMVKPLNSFYLNDYPLYLTKKTSRTYVLLDKQPQSLQKVLQFNWTD